ncbi:MAG TPA: ferritin-like domain-containing protein [Flavisolibacter sp.]|nr:ferritin-like domain-containing protein [Flavisolibacter sp.]
MRAVYPSKYKTQPKFRSDLLTLLSEACEIEHGLACSYLYAAFSLKQSVDENITAIQQQHIRKWASQIFYIASQEMLHLAQVWNLLKAIGGTPYYFRPNFPQGSKYYPFHIPLKLEPFSLEALQRFLLYELPSDHRDKAGNKVTETDYAKKHFGFFSEDNYNYKTVADLYQLIKDGFESMEEIKLFIGNPDWQTGPEEIDFKEIIKVVDRKTAFEAIDMIMHQGEGTPEDKEDCHFGIFKNIQGDYKYFLKDNPEFRPARDIITNPVVFNKGNYGSDKGILIINEITRLVADLFDDIYHLMLLALQYCFGNTEGDKIFNKKIAGFAIQIMVRVIKPLGELLTKLPAFQDSDLKKAGAAFGLSRHISLPNNNSIAGVVLRERASEILSRFRTIDLQGRPEKDVVIFHLADIIQQL